MNYVYYIIHDIISALRSGALWLLVGFLGGLYAYRRIEKVLIGPVSRLRDTFVFSEDEDLYSEDDDEADVGRYNEVRSDPSRPADDRVTYAVTHDGDAFRRCHIRLDRAFAGTDGEGNLEMFVILSRDDDFSPPVGFRLMLDAVVLDRDGTPLYSSVVGALDMVNNPVLVKRDFIAKPQRFFISADEIRLLPRWENVD